MSGAKLACAISVIFAVGCSSSSGGGGGTQDGTADLAAFCQKTASCGTKDIAGESFDQEECEVFLHGWIPPAGCATAVQGASCADFTEPWPNLSASIRSICAPSCLKEHPAECNSDQTQVTVCDPNDGLRTYDCGAYCAGVTMSYSGVCGTSYGGKTSPEPRCWCK